MSELIVESKKVVVPGQILAKGMEYLPSHGTYRLGDEIRANRKGLLSVEGKVLKTIPLSGRYLPRKNDLVIGKVVDILVSGWRIDINSAYQAVLPLKDASFSYIERGADLTRYFALDDWVVCKITNVTSQNLVDVTVKGQGLRKIKGGRILTVNPQRVPRIIGKKGTMVGMVKQATDCKISIGQNGVIWLEGEPDMENLAINTIKEIEQKAHKSGLTNMIKEKLEKITGKTIDTDREDAEMEKETEQRDNHNDRRENYNDRRDNYRQKRYDDNEEKNNDQ